MNTWHVDNKHKYTHCQQRGGYRPLSIQLQNDAVVTEALCSGSLCFDFGFFVALLFCCFVVVVIDCCVQLFTHDLMTYVLD